jgi:EmrB/QacA subfamily drug resistance transporter
MTHFRIDPRVGVCVAFVAAMFMSIMDSTIVNVALPAMGRQFSVPSAALDSVVVAYLTSLAIASPASGWIADRWGTRPVFLAGLTLFGVSSALCGIAGSLTALVVFRFVQGLAGGVLTPIGQSMLYRTFPPAERIRVSRILILATVIAPAAGPALGGWLVTEVSWRWVFFVNVPIVAGTLAFSLVALPTFRDAAVAKLDRWGFCLSAIGFAFLTYALTEGPSQGWTKLATLIPALIGVAALIALVVVEIRAPDPMLNLRLFEDRLFLSANLTSLAFGAGFLGLLFVAPLYLQDGLGASALISGLTTFTEAIGVAVSSQIVARIYPRVGPRRLIFGGLSVAALMMALQAFDGPTTSLWIFRSLMFLTGAGMAFAFMSSGTAAFAAMPARLMSQASALMSVQQRLGSALGVAILSAALEAIGTTSTDPTGALVPNLTSYRIAFVLSALLTFGGGLVALTIHDQDAAATLTTKTEAAIPESALSA